jgi:hypothetical protein
MDRSVNINMYMNIYMDVHKIEQDIMMNMDIKHRHDYVHACTKRVYRNMSSSRINAHSNHITWFTFNLQRRNMNMDDTDVNIDMDVDTDVDADVVTDVDTVLDVNMKRT